MYRPCIIIAEKILSLLPDAVKRDLVLRHLITKLHGGKAKFINFIGLVWDIDISKSDKEIAESIPKCLMYGDVSYIKYDLYLVKTAS